MDNIEKFVLTALAKNGIKGKFLKRIKAGSLFRSDNPEDHFCVFFCAFDPNRKLLFWGKYLKSGLWLVNGIKMSINDCSKVHLLTISDIQNLDPTRECLLYYDYWYFLSVDSANDKFDYQMLKKEFAENRWVSVSEAKKLASHPTTLEGIGFIEKNLL